VAITQVVHSYILCPVFHKNIKLTILILKNQL
jgi:hypothetical protein